MENSKKCQLYILDFQDFPYGGSLLQVPGVSMSVYVHMYLYVSHALRISETSKSEFWNIPEHSTETVWKVSAQIREVWFTDKFRMFWNDPEHCLKIINLIKDEDDILSNPRQIQVYLPWLGPS